MKKYKAMLTSLLLASVMLNAGCSKIEIPDSISNDTKVSDPMTTPVKEESNVIGTLTVASYGSRFSENDIIIKDGVLKVTPTLLGGQESTSAGIVILIDGIPQEYYIDNVQRKTTMSCFDIKAESKEKHTLTIDAQIDPDLKEHYISMMTMVVPDFVPTAEAPSFGFYHSAIHNNAKILPNDCASLLKSDAVILKTENSLLTQKQINRYGLQDDDGGSTGFELRQNKNDDLESWYTLDEGDSLKLTFASYTTEHITPEGFRVTFYKNHKLCKFNGGYTALDMSLEGGKITEMEIELDGVEKGDFVYCVASPLNLESKGVKSKSMMVVGSDGQFGDQSTPPTTSSNISGNSSEQNTPPASSSNSNSNNDGNDGNSGNSSGGTTNKEEMSNKLTPKFTIGETVYFTTKEDVLMLCSSKNGTDIYKKYPLENNLRITVHGEYISVLSTQGSVVQMRRNHILTLLDKELNVVKRKEIAGPQSGAPNFDDYDFDSERIVCLDDKKAIRCYDWDFENETTLLSLPRDDVKTARYFKSIALADGFVAFTAQGKEGNTDKDFYGICDFGGNFEIHEKDEIAGPTAFGKSAVWADMHKGYGVSPSGEVIIYRNGRFETLKTEIAFESQNVFLGDDDTIITTTDNTDACENDIRVYKNGKLTAKMSLGEDVIVYSVVKFGDKFIMSINESNERKTVVWEMN